jgi:hypothetical protein
MTKANNSQTPQQQAQQKEIEALTPKGRFNIFTPIRISSEFDDKMYVEYMMNSSTKTNKLASLSGARSRNFRN